jgi:hypothetical protein
MASDRFSVLKETLNAKFSGFDDADSNAKFSTFDVATLDAKGELLWLQGNNKHCK